MQQNSKKLLSSLNWKYYKDAELNKKELSTLAGNAYWWLPQLSALLGSEIPLFKNERGLYSFEGTALAIGAALKHSEIEYANGTVVSAADFSGMMRVIKYCPRGDLLATSQTKTTRWAANVPIFLAAMKEYRNIPYKAWDLGSNPYMLLDKDNADLLTKLGEVPDYTADELLEFREVGRTIKSGANAGVQKGPLQATALTGIDDKTFTALPRLTKLLLAQVWVYHPSIVSDYAIRNLKDLDAPAVPLVDEEIFVKEEEAPSKYSDDIRDIFGV